MHFDVLVVGFGWIGFPTAASARRILVVVTVKATARDKGLALSLLDVGVFAMFCMFV